MKFFFIALLLLVTACDEKATSGGVAVHRGDPTRRVPKRKEKAATIIAKFNELGITSIDCAGGSCLPEHEDQLQILNYFYTNFQNHRGMVTAISLGATDVIFDAKDRVLLLPISLTEKVMTNFFDTQKYVKVFETYCLCSLSFPKDTFNNAILQRTLFTVSQRKVELRSLNSKIDWIHFDGKDSNCTNRVWSISRDQFENHFDENFKNLKCN